MAVKDARANIVLACVTIAEPLLFGRQTRPGSLRNHQNCVGAPRPSNEGAQGNHPRPVAERLEHPPVALFVESFAAEPDGNFYERDVLPCDQPHTVEVFAVFTVTGDQYPGDAAAEKFVDRCTSEYAAYAAEDAPYTDIEALRPTAQTWGEGVRTVKCLAVSKDPVTESVKG